MNVAAHVLALILALAHPAPAAGLAVKQRRAGAEAPKREIYAKVVEELYDVSPYEAVGAPSWGFQPDRSYPQGEVEGAFHQASSRNSPGYVSTQESEKEMYSKMGEETKGCPKDLFRSSRNPSQYTPASEWTNWMRASTGPAVSALVARRQAENASTPIRVFECGCGVGGALSTIPRLFPEQKFVLNGIDFSAPQVEVAQRCLPAGSTVATGNCSDLHGRVASSSADVVLSIGSGFRAVASMADAKNQLSELLRVASPGAVVAITHVVMRAGDSRSEPQCTDPVDTGFQIPHKWWADELKALDSNRAVHFIDDPQYRANKFEKFTCRYSVWIDREGSLEG